MVEYLIRLLTPQYKAATLSRGYGRITKGIRFATPEDDATTLGDEPYQLYKKFEGKIPITVGAERALAIPYIIDQFPDTDIILLDDSFQHRKVKATFQMVLTDYQNPFYEDFVLPAGRLRESRTGVIRADAVVVTKCPFNLAEDEMMTIEQAVRQYTARPIFFAAIQYGNPLAFKNDSVWNNRVILVSGIANHKTFEHYVSSHYKVLKHFAFADHHPYTSSDLKEICTLAKKENAIVLTTEKDSVKLDIPSFEAIISDVPFFYLPIKTVFLKNGKEFDEMVLNVIQLHAS